MKKLLLIIVIVLVILIAFALFAYNRLFGSDQITLQYEKETTTPFKRALSFEEYQLDAFDKYDEIHKMVHGKNIEVIQQHLIDGDFKAVELCQYYLKRIEKYASYNTVIQLNPNVLEEARLLDERIAKGETAKLFGVMVLIKDNIAAINMNTSAGAYVLKDLTTSRDAFIVAQLKAQGALILGKANLSEWSNFISVPSSNGFSVLGGQTKNAYGQYDVGGSSSGSSAAAALSLAAVTIGTETSGSLIYPAGQNSVFALKPTMGLLSRDLIIPIAEAQDTAGVISRNADDLNLVFNAIIKDDPRDHASSIFNAYTADIDLREDYFMGKHVGVYDTGGEELKEIASKLEVLGAKVTTITLPDETYKIDMLSVLSHGIVHDVKLFLTNPSVNSKVKSLEEVIAYNKENKEVIPFGQYYFENAICQPIENIDEIIKMNKSITSGALDKAFDDNDLDVILSLSNHLSAVYAPAGYPALTIPAGYRENGEPYGLTLVGKALDDQTLINMAYAYEYHYKIRKEIE